MPRPVSRLELSDGEREELKRRLSAPTTSRRDYLRAGIVWFRSRGVRESDIAAWLGVSLATVSKWSRRFEQSGLEGLGDRPGRGRRATLGADKVRQVLSRAAQPPAHGSRWSVRSMADAVGISARSVHRIWQRHGFKPHLEPSAAIPDDPACHQSLWDVIGLYLHPPDKALLLCCSEPGADTALQRHPHRGLPGRGEPRSPSHDYKRHGTITLFAALHYLEGKVPGRTGLDPGGRQWLRFLGEVDGRTRGDWKIHLILDEFASRGHSRAEVWLSLQDRFHLHRTPEGSPWMHCVESFFASLAPELVREGSFSNIPQLVCSIEDYLIGQSNNPRPFHWSARAESIPHRLPGATP
jgi:transposase